MVYGESGRTAVPLPKEVSFNAHIRPILSNTCFTCHGPDEKANESGFVLDSFQHATSPLPSDEDLVGIKPGEPLQSEVYLRITGRSDSGEQMPPIDFRHRLSERDKELFRLWIEQGAEYEQHWSYAALARNTPPQPNDPTGWIINPIDAYILSRLQQEQLEPAPTANKATLLRRLTLDLIGLPPTPDELAAFLSDESDHAYEQVVERLLASPHFGERMASYWLDLVRFADTVGFHGDQNQRIFPYRDYVIDAFNSNKPFDEFTREQLAGDLLPDPSEEQLVATGFLRLNMMTREGGAQPAEYLAKYRADRVRALGTAWLGSTLGCCECHNHKYDPFTARDFYSFGAFFDDLRQWGVYSEYGYTPNADLRGYNNDFPFPPEIRLESKSLRAELAQQRKLRDEQLFVEFGKSVSQSASYEAWCATMKQHITSQPNGWMPLTVDSVNSSTESKHEVLNDQSVLFQGKPQSGDLIAIDVRAPAAMSASSMRVEILPHERNDGFVGRAKEGRFTVSDFALFLEKEPQAISSPRVVPTEPRYIRIELPGDNKILSLAEVEVFAMDGSGKPKNIAKNGKAEQSSDYGTFKASLAIDGNTDGYLDKTKSVTHTKQQRSPWWELDLLTSQNVGSITVWNRTDSQLQSRLAGAKVILLDDARRRLHETEFALPEPSTEIELPADVELPKSTPIRIAWRETDRSTPQTYTSGHEPTRMEPIWKSGPAKWQLPTDEAKLPHTAILHFDQPLDFTPDSLLRLKFISSDIGRLRLSLTPIGHAIAGWDAVDRELRQALNTSAKDRNEAQSASLVSAYHRSTVPIAEQSETSRTFRERILALRTGVAKSMVAQALPTDAIPVSRVLPRGNWQDTSGGLAPPGFPGFLQKGQGGPEPNDARLTRLDLANWLTSPANPLTARHFVNRTWRQFFSTGLSGKLDDLGNQGEWPSHPRLLDWLASEFIDSDWNVKHIVRLIVQSNAYRQDAAVRSDLTGVDPYNRLLAQQSPRRLEAEIVRDNALSISGLLRKDYIGGPSVFPHQPEGHYRNIQFPDRIYQANDDWRKYRRGVYMHWQRSFLHPMLVNFDAPSRDECTADRPQSNSPQQALTLLNDPVFVEAANAMASHVSTECEHEDFATMLEAAYLKALSRKPTESEQTGLRTLYADQLAYYLKHPDETRAQSDNKLPADGSPIQAARRAAFAQVCRVILNLHETITRY